MSPKKKREKKKDSSTSDDKDFIEVGHGEAYENVEHTIEHAPPQGEPEPLASGDSDSEESRGDLTPGSEEAPATSDKKPISDEETERPVIGAQQGPGGYAQDMNPEKMMAQFVDQQIQAAFAIEGPKIVGELKDAIPEAVEASLAKSLQRIAAINPQVTNPGAGGGAIPGSNITPAGIEVIKLFTEKPEQTNLIPAEIQKEMFTGWAKSFSKPSTPAKSEFETYRAGQKDMLDMLKVFTSKGVRDLSDRIIE